jgi:tRNA A37 N6-isopentenylltransferase MiaA
LPDTPKSDLKENQRMIELMKKEGWTSSFERFSALDPQYAQTIPKNNFVRLARGIFD